MKKILTISLLASMTVFSTTNVFAAPKRGGEKIMLANVSSWGSKFSHPEDPSKFGKSGQLGDFVILEKLADNTNSKKENDKIVALVAINIAEDGAEFMPMVLECKQGNSGRWGGWTKYMSKETVGTWLCANGKAGEDCNDTSTAYNVNEWNFLKSSARKQLSLDNATEITSKVTGLDEYHWWTGGDKREGNIIVAVVGYTPSGKGVYAAPVTVRCVGDRGGSMFHSFDGKFGEFVQPKEGKKRILCPSGYKATSKDCEKIIDPVLQEANRPKISIEAPDGTLKTYYTEGEITAIKAQQARKGYDATKHSVYEYSKGKFAVFCKDTSTGLTSQDPLTCSECTSGLRRGVCVKSGKENFGVCSQCNQGKIYNEDKCVCEDAVPVSLTEMAFGKGNTPIPGTVNTCWSKDNEADYKDCVNNIKPAQSPIDSTK